jgi:hypothetical protein
MGKAAENERTKLNATFYNNAAVGTFLSGLIIPYIGFYRAVAEGPPSTSHMVLAGVSAAVALSLAWEFRIIADRIIAKLKD